MDECTSHQQVQKTAHQNTRGFPPRVPAVNAMPTTAPCLALCELDTTLHRRSCDVGQYWPTNAQRCC